ncbi:hypothetical protein CYLTODRAFT_294355 [Cylindrobasidium torrendii FP15055 ss-10]|uniref:Uncharacterized protein n=1 Tax=Cylindrobasidium torrendii FP15055 ss-10 TaxID=1314674 RepID=A0A0D7BB48_9AGAR|nr:hypothetical protein CYLTODRAFT_294355 [Cylindrobasidium torrendii FP15055 ss-10]
MPFTASETPERARVAFANRRLPLPFPSTPHPRYAPYTSGLTRVQPRSKTPPPRSTTPPHTPARAYAPLPALHTSIHPLCRPQTPPQSSIFTLPETPGFALAPFTARPMSPVQRQRSQLLTFTPQSGLPSPPASPSKPSSSSSKLSGLSSKVFGSLPKSFSSSSESSASSWSLKLPPISAPTEPLSPPPSPSKPSFWRAPTRADPLDKYWRDRKAFYVGHLEHVLHGPVHETDDDEREETAVALDVSAVDVSDKGAKQTGAGTEDEPAQGVEEPPLAVEDEPVDIETISEDDDTDSLWTPYAFFLLTRTLIF